MFAPAAQSSLSSLARTSSTDKQLSTIGCGESEKPSPLPDGVPGFENGKPSKRRRVFVAHISVSRSISWDRETKPADGPAAAADAASARRRAGKQLEVSGSFTQVSTSLSDSTNSSASNSGEMLGGGRPWDDWRDGGSAIIVVGPWSPSLPEGSRRLGVARWLCDRSCLEIDGPSLDSLAVCKDACATTRSRLELPSLADKGMSLTVPAKPSDAARWPALRGRSEIGLGLPTFPSTLRWRCAGPGEPNAST